MSEQHEETGQQRFARLLRLEMSERGLTPARLEPLIGSTDRSIENWLNEGKTPQPSKRGAIERGLRWRRGAITELLDESPFRTIRWDLDAVRIPDPAKQPVARAADLTDDELLTEVTRRFKTYADKATTPALPAEEEWRRFGLAAHHDPTEPKTRQPKN